MLFQEKRDISSCRLIIHKHLENENKILELVGFSAVIHVIISENLGNKSIPPTQQMHPEFCPAAGNLIFRFICSRRFTKFSDKLNFLIAHVK
jgi:hypothetical protein